MAADDFEQTMLAKFAEVVLRLGDAVAVGDENVAGAEVFRALFPLESVDEADDRATAVEARHRIIGAEQQRSEMPPVGVDEPPRDSVVMGEEQRRVFFRLGAAVEMAVQQRKDPGGLLEEFAALDFLCGR